MSSNRSFLSREELICSLHSIGCICFGSFTLKSGIQSPIYIDLRLIVSHPHILASVAHLMYSNVVESADPPTPFSLLCGVPYTALPIATAMSLQHGTPMVMRRKEVKTYGLKKAIEGAFKEGDNVLIVEDIVTSALSVFETVDSLCSSGLVVDKVSVLIDRQQGGRDNLKGREIRLFAVFTLTEIIDVLSKGKRITEEMKRSAVDFIKGNQIVLGEVEAKRSEVVPVVVAAETFERRATMTTNQMAKRLFTICSDKKSNLCVSADFTHSADIVDLIEAVGERICCLKVHMDIVEDFNEEFVRKLRVLAEKYNFLIFEDRKFADIGSTLQMQYAGGVHRIKQWANIVNLHLIAGEETVEALKAEAMRDSPNGAPSSSVLLVAEMSSKGNLITPHYTSECVKVAEANEPFVMGFICQHQLTKDGRFVHMTPGVQMDWEKEKEGGEGNDVSGSVKRGDGLGQQYNHPRLVVEKGSDIIIVGRGIIGQPKEKRAAAAAVYQQTAWKAYQRRVDTKQ